MAWACRLRNLPSVPVAITEEDVVDDSRHGVKGGQKRETASGVNVRERVGEEEVSEERARDGVLCRRTI